jgi:hypothetical protein
MGDHLGGVPRRQLDCNPVLQELSAADGGRIAGKRVEY